MLSIGGVRVGQVNYYTSLAREDYYLEGGEPPGRWYGEGAALLGLGQSPDGESTGLVEKKELANLFKGFSKYGHRLVQNAGKKNRQAGLDLTFTPGKSVSYLWFISNDELQKAIEGEHEKAVHRVLDCIQQEAGWTRVGKGGEKFVRCKLVFATFLHSTSRAMDMNLHTHVLVPNVGITEDGKTRALWNKEIYEHKMAAGALYRVALAHGLAQKLGVGIEMKSELGDFKVRGIDERLCRHHSKRRNQIEEHLKRKGYSTARAASIANLETREVKGHVSRPELFARWERELKELGYTRKGIIHEYERFKGMTHQAQNPERLASCLAEWLAREYGTFRKQDLIREVAFGCTDGVTRPEDVLKAVAKTLGSEQVRYIGQGKKNKRSKQHELFTTEKALSAEDGLFQTAFNLDDQRPSLRVSEKIAKDVRLRHGGNVGMGERRKAFDYLTLDPGNLKLLTGMAGTGKTSLLRAANDAWQKQGYRVVGMALSGKASRELQKGAGIKTETIRKRQLQLAPSLEEKARHVGREFYRAFRWGKAKKYRPYHMERLKLDRKTVLVIDESSMVGLKDTAQMLRLANEAGAKVVMVGDERQLPAIQAVSPFAALQQHIGQFELKDIVRQRDKWMRHAVEAFAEGESRTGLSLLAEHESLHLGKGGPEDTKQQLIDDWSKDQTHLSEKLILAATNAGAKELNAKAQEKRRESGELGIRGVELGSGEKAYRGDRVMFLKNHRRLNVCNGEIGTVTRVIRPLNTTFNKGELVIKMDHGKKIRVNLNKYNELSLGYALTTHKAQGMTVDSTYVYATPEHVDLHMAYVQMSRSRESTRLYSPGFDYGEDLEELSRAMERERTPKLAKEREAEIDLAKKAEEQRRIRLEQNQDKLNTLELER